MSESLHNTKVGGKEKKPTIEVRREYQTGIITGLISTVSGVRVTAFPLSPLGWDGMYRRWNWAEAEFGQNSGQWTKKEMLSRRLSLRSSMALRACERHLVQYGTYFQSYTICFTEYSLPNFETAKVKTLRESRASKSTRPSGRMPCRARYQNGKVKDVGVKQF